ncbi:murein biosynthesis integral membrane protein MurJ [bacterium]|nr:murein biosynthesis integral membrane protein MurJ [bacterium]
MLVGMGIFLSRFAGLIRERVFAHYFGNSIAAAAFKAALRIPNFLQNLFGEGVLSASFIPVYASLIGQKKDKDAETVANAVFGLLLLMVALVVGLSIVFTPVFIDMIAPGFHDETRNLAITLVRIIFPGTGLLVLSAWCLGILNSHRRFLLSYAAPVFWNAAIIGALLIFGGTSQDQLAIYTAYGLVVGCLLQFLVQMPSVLKLIHSFKPSLSVAHQSVRQIIRSFGPLLVGRGVVQVSAYIDTAYGSLISERALSALAYAQTLYLIPVSLFGMAISAAELPAMSQASGTPEEVAQILRARINDGLRNIAFFVIPSVVAFLVLGDVVSGALFQTGRFTPEDTRYLWYLLMGATVGLLATTMGRLYSSTFYALKDTKTPLYFAMVRVALTAISAYWCAVKLPGVLGLPQEMGGVGITATTGFSAWIEFLLLRSTLSRRIGKTGVPRSSLIKLWGSALGTGAIGLVIKYALALHYGFVLTSQWGGKFLAMPFLSPVITALAVLVPFSLLYLGFGIFFNIPEALVIKRKILKR